jgi:hypothetical protein
MELRQYDLYENISGGNPRWIGAAATLEHARIRLRELAAASPAVDYFAREFRSGVVVAVARGPRAVARRPLANPRALTARRDVSPDPVTHRGAA